MAEEIPFDKIRDPRRHDVQDHEVSDDDFQVPQSNNENNAVKKSYLGTRRDRSGKWVRRHCSEKRYPRMAEKSSSASTPQSTSTCREPNNKFIRQENKQSHIREQGRSTSSPRQKRRNAYRHKREQQQMQQNSLQVDHSQQPLHIGYQRRTHREDNHLRIESKDIYDNHNSNRRLVQSNPILPPNTSKSSQPIASNNLAEQSRAYERRHAKQKKHKLIFDVSSMQTNQMVKNIPTSKIDEISGLFTTSSKITSSTKHSDIDNNDEERIRRFGAAYNAIMLAHQVNEVKPPESRPTYSGKRWARDPKIISAMSIDGRTYSDLQRTPTLSLKQMMTTPDVYDSKRGMLNVELHDRKASWLVHMPRNLSKCSGEEKQLSQINEERATHIKDFSTSHRDRGHVTVIEDSSTLTPCLRKLNDIETTIQSVEKGLKFDLEENRRAVVRDGLSSRHQLSAQRSGTSTSSIHKRFKHFTIHEKSTVEDHLGSTESENGINGNDNDNDNNSGIDSTPIVNTSALRLLFSGKAEDNHKESSDYDPNAIKFESNEIMPLSSHKSSILIPSNSSPFNRIEEDVDGNEESVPHNQHKSPVSEDEVDAVMNANSQFESPLDNNQSLCDAEQQAIEKNITLEPDQSIYRPDPPGSANRESKDVSLSQPQLNVANLVRASLVIHARSFIDTDENLDDFDEEEEQAITRSMLMSPSLITKRYQQVLKAIEAKKWEQVSYLTHANPWLMEMKDVRNDQYLIHSLALYSGDGQTDVDVDASTDQLSIQKEIVFNILDYEPGVVHKLDTEGYLPLHMAAASGNVMMIKVLGEKFPAAASVQNHDGLLPLHLAVMSCALYATGVHAVDLILNLFPTGIVVKDCDGNTPLHTAAGALRGHVGVSIISRLLQVHEDILTRNPSFLKEAMGEPKIPKHFDEVTVVTLEDAGDDSSNGFLPMVKNKRGETPLVRAIKSKAGRQVIDVLLAADGGSLATLDENAVGATALHLILRNEFYDAGTAISILKAAPSAAAIRDVKRTLPIQLACSNVLQREIILAIAIVDLPIDLGAKEEVIHRNGFGASWWFLLCESNDQFVDIVAEILALCSHQQKMALCLTSAEGREDDTAIAYATPLCKATLRKGLRFLGRFEFTGGPQISSSSSREVQKFNALDYGNNASNEVKKVSLVCFGSNDVYAREAKHLNESKLDFKFYEELRYFAIGDENVADIPSGLKLRHCVAVTKSKLSLSRVVAGMPRNHGYRADLNLLRKYYGKVKSILFRVGEGICKLHVSNIIHGQIDSRSIMKFGDKWKITGLCGSVVRGGLFPKTRIGSHSPPEFFVAQLNESASTSKKSAIVVANPSIDIWAFGKLMFEAFVGESIFASFVENDDEELEFGFIAGWSNRHIEVVTKLLTESGIGDLGLDLVCSCLQLEPSRSKSMTKILRHDFWKEKY